MKTKTIKPDPNNGQPSFPDSSPRKEKDQIILLGVQGLSYNDYSAIELKVGLQLIKHAQQVIKEYTIPYKLNHDTFDFSKERRIAGYTDVCLKLSELGISVNHYTQVRDAIYRMAKKPIDIPYKVGDRTIYTRFDWLFSAEVYKNRKGRWTVRFRFDNTVLRFFYAFDKGACRIDLNAVNACRSATSIKLYIIMNCWAAKGFTQVKPEHLMRLLHGKGDCYKTWSDLERHGLRFAIEDLKRLYDHGIIEQYLAYKPYFPDEEGGTDDDKKKHHHMPQHITFTILDRDHSGQGKDEKCERLRGEQGKLGLLLKCRFGVTEKVADRLKQRLRLDMLGELADWLERKEYYLEHSRKEHRQVNAAAYIVKSLDGFFKDRNA